MDGGGLAGSRFDVGERIVAPALWRRKIPQVDALVLSHADFDHYGGLTFLADAFGRRGTSGGMAAPAPARTSRAAKWWRDGALSWRCGKVSRVDGVVWCGQLPIR